MVGFMEEIHDNNDNMRVVLGADFVDPTKPRAQFSKIHLHIHRTNFVGPTLIPSHKDSTVSVNLPFLFLLQEETLIQAVSALNSRVDTIDRHAAESAKGLICSFFGKSSYRCLDSPTGTVEFTVRIFVTLFNGLPWQEAFDGSDLVCNEEPIHVRGMNNVCETCAICIEDFIPGEKIRKTACNHEFHEKCLDKWLLRKRSCPLCRFDL